MELSPDVLVLLGDVTNDAAPAAWSAVGRELNGIPVPVEIVGGNHDWPHPIVRPEIPLFDRIELADLVVESQVATGRRRPAPAPGRPRVVVSHYPVIRPEGVPALIQDCPVVLGNAGAVRERLIADDGPAVLLHGHLHRRTVHTDRHVLQLGCASLVDPPHDVTVVDVEQRRVRPGHVPRGGEAGAPHDRAAPGLGLTQHVDLLGGPEHVPLVSACLLRSFSTRPARACPGENANARAVR